MRFGIYTEMQTPLEKPHAELTWEIMRQIEHEDAVGFETYSVIEHHFFQQFGISANPLALFTAAAQRTHRIRFRTLCHTLPLHNPLLLDGEIAADILTHGRLEYGAFAPGPGWGPGRPRAHRLPPAPGDERAPWRPLREAVKVRTGHRGWPRKRLQVIATDKG
jgi:alkanesulfonate monooxygenase SsuD/methylene tetrahydromethanopterin reductase-like flavin-dependent oxidoreductase (luciferase family)